MNQQVIRSGMNINRPAQYLQLSALMGQSNKGGEDVRTREQVGENKKDIP